MGEAEGLRGVMCRVKGSHGGVQSRVGGTWNTPFRAFLSTEAGSLSLCLPEGLAARVLDGRQLSVA